MLRMKAAWTTCILAYLTLSTAARALQLHAGTFLYRMIRESVRGLI